MRRTAALLLLLAAGAGARAAVSTDTVASGLIVSSASFQQTGVALDSRNNVHAVYVDSATLTLKYALLSNGTTTWSVSNIATAQVGPHCAIALENGLTPHVVYYQTSGTPALMHAERSGSAWSTDTVETFTGTNTFVSIAVGADRNPRVAYYNSVSSATSFASQSGSVWSTFTVVTSTYGGPVDLALNASDLARLALVSGSTTTSQRFLTYARQSGSSFLTSSPFVIGTDTTSLGAMSLALDSAGEGHVAFYDGFNDGLSYVRFDTAGATVAATGAVIDTNPGAGFFCDVVVNASDRGTILYHSNGAGLRTAVFDGTNWNLNTVESGTTVGVGVAAVMNRFDHYLATHFNADTGEVQFITDAFRNLSIAGTVQDFAAAPIPGVDLVLSGQIASTSLSISSTTGAFSADSLFEGNYALVPSLSGYAFVPTGRAYTGLQASVVGQNFVGGPVNVSTVGNLFDPSAGEFTTFNFSVVPGPVVLEVFTLQGRRVKTLVNETKSAGSYTVTWDGRTDDGDVVASGIYLIRYETPSLEQTLKVAVVK